MSNQKKQSTEAAVREIRRRTRSVSRQQKSDTQGPEAKSWEKRKRHLEQVVYSAGEVSWGVMLPGTGPIGRVIPRLVANEADLAGKARGSSRS